MDRRTLLAIVLCFLIFLGWQKFYIEPNMPKQAPRPTAESVSPASPPQAQQTPPAQLAQPIKPPANQPAADAKSVGVSTGVAKVGNGEKFFTGWDLRAYKLGISQEAAAVDLKSLMQQDGAGEFAFDHPDYAYLNQVRGTLSGSGDRLFWQYEDDKVKLTREIVSSSGQPFVDLKLTADFKGQKPGYAFVSLSQSAPAQSDGEEMDRALIYWTKKDIERVSLKDTIELSQVATPVKWIATTNRYFLMSLIPQGGPEAKGLVQPLGQHSGRVSLVYPVAGNTITIPLRAYFGPKELDHLRAVEPTLDHTVDFGWFTVIAYPLLKLMKWFFGLFHNWGLSIILLTILVKILTYPLTYKSMKSMKEMAKLQPQLTRLRDKYKDDKEALNREMLGLMRSHGYNPMAGCFPILIQMPVFFALYRVLYSSIELYHAPFLFWIQDLSAKDPFYVTPVLLTVTMFVQQKMTPNTATDPAQQKMLQFMPVIFGVFMLTLPSGLTIYMLVNAITSIIQQMILNKKLDGGHGPVVAALAR